MLGTVKRHRPSAMCHQSLSSQVCEWDRSEHAFLSCSTYISHTYQLCLMGTCVPENVRCEALVAGLSCSDMTTLIWCQTAALCEMFVTRGTAPRERMETRGQ